MARLSKLTDTQQLQLANLAKENGYAKGARLFNEQSGVSVTGATAFYYLQKFHPETPKVRKEYAPRQPKEEMAVWADVEDELKENLND